MCSVHAVQSSSVGLGRIVSARFKTKLLFIIIVLFFYFFIACCFKHCANKIVRKYYNRRRGVFFFYTFYTEHRAFRFVILM